MLERIKLDARALQDAPEELKGDRLSTPELQTELFVRGGRKLGNARKCLGEDAKGRLDPASEKPLALVQNGVAPVQKRFRKVQLHRARDS